MSEPSDPEFSVDEEGKGSSWEELSPNPSRSPWISQNESSVERAQPEGLFSRSLREDLAPTTSSLSGFDGNKKDNESLRTRILSLFLFFQSVLFSISPWL
jgi:hypothetical protein